MTTQGIQNSRTLPPRSKGYKGVAMEGMIARWYAKNTKNRGDYAATAKKVSDHTPPGSRVLEVAPGPGYLAIELGKLGFAVVGLDVSKTFVEIAQANAKQAGVSVNFRHGQAANMPFDNESFDFIVCTAAFKNFAQPIAALNEMQRVLKANGKALVMDLRRDASKTGIDEEVKNMGLNRINSFLTKGAFRFMLLKNAYTVGEIKQFASQTHFRNCEIVTDSIGMEIWLEN
jgi:ubiquinone/menaquinone biosynthesis C-methylase UbiE